MSAVPKQQKKQPKPKSERNRLLAKVHIAKKDLGLDEETYRAVLAEFNVSSAGDMSEAQLKKLVNHFKKKGWKPQRPQSRKRDHGWGSDKYRNFRKGAYGKASHRELRTIEGLWARASFAKDKAASLQSFLRKRFKVSDITWLNADQSPKVIDVLKQMYWRRILKEALKEWTDEQIKRATRFFLEPESEFRTYMYRQVGGHDASDILSKSDEYWIRIIRILFKLEQP